MIRPIPQNKLHPEGGLYVLVTKHKAGKREKSLWYDDYDTKKDCEIASKELELQFEKELSDRVPKAGRENHRNETIESVARKRIEHEGDANMLGYFERIIKLCGNKRVPEWRETYRAVIKKLEETPSEKNNKPRSKSTINRYKSTFSMIFNFAKGENIITELPIAIKKESETGRDRVWTDQERKDIFDAMKDRDSWLYPSIYFSQFNPVRAGDLFTIPKAAYKPLKNWVQFYASKTAEEHNRPTYLKQIDNYLRNYASSLPIDCPYLFPRLGANGSWKKVEVRRGYREYDAEFDAILKAANVENFVFHDLKHCSITYLLDHGYTELDLQQCGIQYSKEMIKRYYHYDAEKAPVLKGFEVPGLKLLDKNGTNE